MVSRLDRLRERLRRREMQLQNQGEDLSAAGRQRLRQIKELRSRIERRADQVEGGARRIGRAAEGVSRRLEDVGGEDDVSRMFDSDAGPGFFESDEDGGGLDELFGFEGESDGDLSGLFESEDDGSDSGVDLV